MELKKRNLVYFVLFIWTPLAVGNFDFIGQYGVASMSIQHLLILFSLISGTCVAFTKRAINFPKYSFYSFILYIGFSSLVLNISFYTLFQFILLCLSIIWAYSLVSYLSIRDFISITSSVVTIWVFLSILYSLIFNSNSFSYVNDIYSMSSFYDHKNTYGRFLLIGVIFHFLNRFYNKDSSGFIFLSVVFIYVTLIYLSKSKTSLGLFFIFLFLYSVVSKSYLSLGSLRKYMTLAISLFCLLIVILVNSGFMYFQNIGSALDCLSIGDYICIPTTGRATIWDTALRDAFLDSNYIFGYGSNGFYRYFADVRLTNIGLGDFIPHDSHNGYIDFFLSYGIVGSVFLVIAVVIIFINTGKTSESLLFTFVFLMLIIIYNLTESYFTKSTNYILFMFFFLLVSCKRINSGCCHGENS
jgi:O-antigen ligase